MAKSSNKPRPKQSGHSRLQGYSIVAIGVIILALGGVYGYQKLSSAWNTYEQNRVTAARKDRILDIYSSLKLGSSYTLTGGSVFGDKRVYSWDKGRTYASSETYVHSANVDVTVAELRSKIEAAGFTFAGEPYPGSSFTELHFKSPKNEYIRLNVSGKPRNDALALQRGNATINFDGVPEPNQGPSDIIIKVNLDDNNE